MAEAKILKKSRRQAVVAAVGTGTVHANLTSLLHFSSNTTGHLAQDQFFSEANAVCTITDVIFTLDNNATVTRGGNTIITLTAGQADFSFAQKYGFVLDDKANANIQINFGANTGSIFLCLTKGDGFNDPNLQILADYQRP